MLDYSTVSKGINVNTPLGLYMDNLKRQEIANKRTIQLMEKYVNELVKLGVNKEVAKAISNTMYRNMVKKARLVRIVKTVEHKRKEKERIQVSITEFNMSIL